MKDFWAIWVLNFSGRKENDQLRMKRFLPKLKDYGVKDVLLEEIPRSSDASQINGYLE
jgi:hypothetical protein